MLRHYAINKNTRMGFTSEEQAKKYCAENAGYEYAAIREWKFYDPHNQNSTTRYVTIKAETLQEAIQHNIKKIMEAMGLSGASGYKIKNAKIVRENEKVFFVAEAWRFSEALVDYNSDMETEKNLKSAKLEIEGVTEEEFPENEFVFELKKPA